MVESAFAMVSRLAGGVILFQIINFTLLLANMGSGMGSQLAAGRLLYGMGRGNALPKSFFGAIEPKHRIPRNNILLIGAIAIAGSGLMEFFSSKLGGGAYEIGAQCLVFGTLIAFMGVNASSFVHLCRHREGKGIIGLLVSLIVPLLGFSICAVLWCSAQPLLDDAGLLVAGDRHRLRSGAHQRLPRRTGQLRYSPGRGMKNLPCGKPRLQ